MTRILAIDGGATYTRAGLYDRRGHLLNSRAAGPSNALDVGVRQCVGLLAALSHELLAGHGHPLDTVAAGIAGAGTPAIGREVARRLLRALRPARVVVSSDILPLVRANGSDGPILFVLAGTGSVVFGRGADGKNIQLGGWGPLLDDAGSAYRVAVEALRAAVSACERLSGETALQQALPTAAGVGSFDDMKAWTGGASRCDIAALAPAVSHCARDGDRTAHECIENQARKLAEKTAAAAGRLDINSSAPVLTHGGLIDNCPLFRRAYQQALACSAAFLSVERAAVTGPAAVLELALAQELPSDAIVFRLEDLDAGVRTEERLALPVPLDRLGPKEIVETMCHEDAGVSQAVADQRDSIAEVVGVVAGAFASGGRLIYAGAGTSGRLGVLDAAECPPTFGVAPGQVAGLIAGGARALRESVEGAEDDAGQGIGDVKALNPPLTQNDVLAAISASGRTLYVDGALQEARRVGAKTVLICCNPDSPLKVDHLIALDTGPEVIAGSTRLKAGTASKMVLNQITTGALTLSGFVYEGLMVNVKPVNAKLRRRAINIVAQLTGKAPGESETLLDRSGGKIPVAVAAGRLGIEPEDATRRLKKAGGSLRALLEEDPAHRDTP